ncbi:hypothetical protein V7152_14055 [Neobacillus drentensis]|uniref:hypothetical protein n=1 Tax=Neobacillus drentensis TaxID=220684 RepID=UPI002FFD8B51
MKPESKDEHSGMEIGIYTLGDLVPNWGTGKAISARQRLEEIIEAWVSGTVRGQMSTSGA